MTKKQATPLQARALGLLSILGPFVTGGICIVWTLVLFRSIPIPVGDHGMFVSVAERLKAGDTLYQEVYENKDPLFHYSLALFRSFSPFGDWALEISWLVSASGAAVSLSRSIGLSFRKSALVGLIISPIVLTGSSYVPGSSHLPSIALTLIALALYFRKHIFWAGVVVGSITLFKLIALPAIFIALLFLLWKSNGRRRLWNFLTGFGSALTFYFVIVVLRGEFVPYMQSLLDTIEYADNQANTGLVSRFVGHIEPVFTAGNLSSAIVALSLLALSFSAIQGRSDWVPEIQNGRAMLIAVFVMLVVNFAVIALTGLWPHHYQIFVSQLILIFIVFIKYFVFDPWKLNAATTAGAILLGYAIAGSISPSVWVNSLLFARANIWEQSQITPETRALKEAGLPSTFARLGTGNDRGFARGLEEWTLKCRYFGQSTLNSNHVLNETLECFPGAQFVIVDADFVELEGANSWNAFVRASESILDAEFSCEKSAESRICIKRL
jgi:hypothetical protein